MNCLQKVRKLLEYGKELGIEFVCPNNEDELELYTSIKNINVKDVKDLVYINEDDHIYWE